MLGASAKPAAMAVPIICLQLYMFCSLQSFDKNDLEFFTFQSFFLEKKTLGMIIEKDFKFFFLHLFNVYSLKSKLGQCTTHVFGYLLVASIKLHCCKFIHVFTNVVIRS